MADLSPDQATPDLSPDQGNLTPDLAGDLGPVAANSFCSAPEQLTLTSGIVSITGATLEAVNEFNGIICGGALLDSMSGPQVYYQVLLEGGKQYKVTALSQSTDYDLALYGFPAATACAADQINLGCTAPAFGGLENVYASDKIGSGRPEVLRIAPQVDEQWIIAVDAYSSNDRGHFSLTVAEIIPAANGSCSQAAPLSVSVTPVSVSGSTDGVANEFGKGITCGGGETMDGAQVYYSFSAAPGKGYGVTLAPSFFSSVYTFPSAASCVAGDVEAGCSSGGQTGVLLGSVAAGFSDTFRFAPDIPGDTLIAVDSLDPLEAGAFELTVQEYDPPSNGKCAAPQPLTLASSPLSVNGDTTGAVNQFGQAITCGTAFSFNGAQLYYSLNLTGGTAYTIEVTPSGWDAAIYLFTAAAACAPAEVELQCSAAGFVADAGTTGGKETLTLTPAETADYLLAVDTYSPVEVGPFELVVSW